MNTYTIKIEIENHFDTVNRILNKFCGRGFEPLTLMLTTDEKKNEAIISITVKGHVQKIQLILKKINSFVDVHRVLAFEEVKKLKVS